MKRTRQILRYSAVLLSTLGFVWACGFDDTLREYLDAHFWLPFSKHSSSFEKRGVRRISAPYAGMVKPHGNTPLDKLRAAYQEISDPDSQSWHPDVLLKALADARADQSLGRREREEVDLIDAKIDMREGEPDATDPLPAAKKKLETFLKTARTPEFLSEARGWLAHVDHLMGNQTAAGKIYLDELNRNGSNLSRETLLNSLQMTYGYDGGPELLNHLEEYFDTPEHAAFAIQIATNPHFDRPTWQDDRTREFQDGAAPNTFGRIQALLQKHSDLLKSETGANALALLSMRVALRMGDPVSAMNIAEMVPADASIRAEPDFDWMLASARFLSHDFAGAEEPLRSLFQSPQSSNDQIAAAAYGLCGVYSKTKDTVKQIWFALWLHSAAHKNDMDSLSYPSGIWDKSVYWAPSGWDLNMLLDAEAPRQELEAFLLKYPNVPDVRLVKYSLAVRLARENRYGEASQIYQSIGANQRAARMRQLAALYEDTGLEGKYKLAEFIATNPERIFFNDALWHGLQRYALYAQSDVSFTRAERQAHIEAERKLKDDQEERWQAYLILRDVIKDAGKADLGRKAAKLAIRCVRGINTDRFGRPDELRDAEIELSRWLSNN